MLAKKLRLVAAARTDIGRRRERNQDNETHLIPEDEELLDSRGAMFVVCDGMGGHAAGEIAAELGAKTIQEVYYSQGTADIVQSLAVAIKHANDAIHNFAHENPDKLGMGTTCVALVIHGGKGYFLNIGDSRGYIVRRGAMRQVTQDHSWVAEQVRAGLLTEEQARTHAHRNVITRSLGTQPNVTADLFVEPLYAGDRVLLCTDGLHGYVDEAEIEREMVTHVEPDSAVSRLIDMANDNGGPDNITASIVHILEVPDAIEDEATQPAMPDSIERTTTQPILVSTGPSEALKAPGRRARRRRGSRSPAQIVATNMLRLLAVVALVVLAADIWYVALGPYAVSRAATTRAQQDVARAQQLASQAKTSDPMSMLKALAQVRQQLLADAHNPDADPAARQGAQTAITAQVVPAVQQSMERYNETAMITEIPSTSVTTYNVTCTGSGQSILTNVSAMVALPAGAAATNGSTQPVFVLNGGNLFQVNVALDSTGAPKPGAPACAATSVSGASATLAIAADGPTLYTLSRDSSGGYGVYSLSAQSPAPGAPPKLTSKLVFQLPSQQGDTPIALAVNGTNYSVGYSAGNGPGGIWVFSGSAPKSPAQVVTLPQTNGAPSISALTAAHGTIYALMSDGSLGQIDSAHNYLPLPVTVMPPVAPFPPSSYTGALPVPTVPQTPAAQTPSAGGSSSATLFSTNASLAAVSTNKPIVLVGDAASGRVVSFAPGATPGLQLAGQYVYGKQLADVSGLAAAQAGQMLTIYLWSGSQLATYDVAQP